MTRASRKVLIELRPSKVDTGGVGVFAITDIRKGEKVADGINEEDYKQLIPWKNVARYDRRLYKKVRDFCLGTPGGFIPPEGLDFNRLSVEWYFNHSCDGNIGFDNKGDFVAIRKIKKGEELTYDYALAESNPKFKMRCRCNSKNCRGVVTGNDWKNKKLRSEKSKYMLPRLRTLPKQK